MQYYEPINPCQTVDPITEYRKESTNSSVRYLDVTDDVPFYAYEMIDLKHEFIVPRIDTFKYKLIGDSIINGSYKVAQKSVHFDSNFKLYETDRWIQVFVYDIKGLVIFFANSF